MAAAAATGGGSGPPTGVRFVPLLGVHGRGPLSYLLVLEGFTFLLDCGWNDAYDTQLLAPVLASLPHIDAGAQATSLPHAASLALLLPLSCSCCIATCVSAQVTVSAQAFTIRP